MILLAVALFAALSYAVTQSTRSGGGNASRETAVTQAAHMVQIVTGMEAALQRFIISNGYDIMSIDIKPTTASNPLFNIIDQSCNSDACNLLAPSGGGFILPKLPLTYTDPSYTFTYASYVSANGVQWDIIKQVVTGVGTSLPDMILVVYGIRRDICEEINRKFDTGSASGIYHRWSSLDSIFPNVSMSPPNNARTWCHIQGGIYGSYFHHVLWPR